jgi:hypothetical protein
LRGASPPRRALGILASPPRLGSLRKRVDVFGRAGKSQGGPRGANAGDPHPKPSKEERESRTAIESAVRSVSLLERRIMVSRRNATRPSQPAWSRSQSTTRSRERGFLSDAIRRDPREDRGPGPGDEENDDPDQDRQHAQGSVHASYLRVTEPRRQAREMT